MTVTKSRQNYILFIMASKVSYMTELEEIGLNWSKEESGQTPGETCVRAT